MMLDQHQNLMALLLLLLLDPAMMYLLIILTHLLSRLALAKGSLCVLLHQILQFVSELFKCGRF